MRFRAFWVDWDTLFFQKIFVSAKNQPQQWYCSLEIVYAVKDCDPCIVILSITFFFLICGHLVKVTVKYVIKLLLLQLKTLWGEWVVNLLILVLNDLRIFAGGRSCRNAMTGWSASFRVFSAWHAANYLLISLKEGMWPFVTFEVFQIILLIILSIMLISVFVV